MSSELRCWYAAVDWASEKHDIVVTDCEGKRLGRLQVEHSGGERLARMSDWLIATTGGTPDEIHIAIEVPHGPIEAITSQSRLSSLAPSLHQPITRAASSLFSCFSSARG